METRRCEDWANRIFLSGVAVLFGWHHTASDASACVRMAMRTSVSFYRVVRTVGLSLCHLSCRVVCAGGFAVTYARA